MQRVCVFDRSFVLHATPRRGERQGGLQQAPVFRFRMYPRVWTTRPEFMRRSRRRRQRMVFRGDDTRDNFCEWLFTKEHANCIVVAHNFQGYDSYFILQCLRENGVQYDVIMRGAKVLTLSTCSRSNLSIR